jgi:hypothetical protein
VLGRSCSNIDAGYPGSARAPACCCRRLAGNIRKPPAGEAALRTDAAHLSGVSSTRAPKTTRRGAYAPRADAAERIHIPVQSAQRAAGRTALSRAPAACKPAIEQQRVTGCPVQAAEPARRVASLCYEPGALACPAHHRQAHSTCDGVPQVRQVPRFAAFAAPVTILHPRLASFNGEALNLRSSK